MKTRCTIVALLCGLALAAAGCKGTTSTGTTYTTRFPSGEVEARVTADHFTVHEVARDVLEKEFLYSITLERVDGRVGVIQATTAKNRKVKVESQREGDHLTRLRIYVAGDLGADKAAEVDILTRIEQKLKEMGK